MGDSRIVIPVIVGILILGTLGFNPFAFAGVFADTVTVDGVDTQGDCESMLPLGLEGTFDGITKTCTLQNNLDIKIIIQVDDFTLDCNNKVIQSLDVGTGQGITVDASSNVDITQCVVNDFENNIVVENSNDNEISNNMLNGAQTNGISLVNSNDNMIFGNSGDNNDFLLGLLNSDGNTVEFNSMSDGQNGMAIAGSSQNTISNNSIFDNSNSGFQIFGGSNNTIFDNSISGNADFGLQIENSNDNQILENTIEGNDSGLVIFGGARNLIFDNIVQNNSGNGLSLTNSNENQIMGNLIAGNSGLGGEYGIFFDGSDSNTIFKNNISNNGLEGIALFGSSNNIIFNNNLINNPNQILDDFGVNNQFNMPLPVGGNYIDTFDESGEGCNDVVPPNDICDDPFVFSGGQDNLPWTKPNGWLNPPTTPVDKIEELIVEVDKLDLNAGNKNALTKKLDNAIKNITNEDPTDDSEACEKLQAFNNQLNAFVKSGKLDVSDTIDMSNSANDLIDELCPDP